MPVRSLSSSLATTSRSGMGRADPPGEGARPGPRASGATSSWSVFHLWQDGHWPSHFGEECPHSAQAKSVRGLLAARPMEECGSTRL